MKKDIKFSTRMASEDREAIKELAKRSGMSMSDYVTACCLGKQVVVVDGLKEEYDKIMSWADLYAGSSIEGKKMILRQLIERVNIGKNFEIEVEFKISVTQFFDFLYPEGDKSVYYRAS